MDCYAKRRNAWWCLEFKKKGKAVMREARTGVQIIISVGDFNSPYLRE